MRKYIPHFMKKKEPKREVKKEEIKFKTSM